MNKRGQALVTFILMLPIIVLFVAFFIDSLLSVMEKNRIDGIITSNMQISLDNNIHDSNKIINAIKENDDNLDVLVLTEDILDIQVSVRKKNLFGNILKMKWYDLNFHYCANYIDKEINKNCGWYNEEYKRRSCCNYF